MRIITSLKHNSTASYDILIYLFQTSTGQRSFAYSGPVVWNSLSPVLRENMLLATFKTKLKTYLFRRSQWLSKTTRRCCGGFAISAPWYKWLHLLTYLKFKPSWSTRRTHESVEPYCFFCYIQAHTQYILRHFDKYGTNWQVWFLTGLSMKCF